MSMEVIIVVQMLFSKCYFYLKELSLSWLLVYLVECVFYFSVFLHCFWKYIDSTKEGIIVL